MAGKGETFDYGLTLGRRGRAPAGANSPRCGVIRHEQEDGVPTGLIWRVAKGVVTDADTGTTKAIVTLPDQSLVRSVLVEIVTAFTGGTPALDVGDGADVDGFVAAANITEATPGFYGLSDRTLGAYLYLGTAGLEERITKYYATSDTVDVVVSASLTAGKAFIFVEYATVDDLDDAL